MSTRRWEREGGVLRLEENNIIVFNNMQIEKNIMRQLKMVRFDH